MNLTDFLDKNLILPNLAAESQQDILRELAAPVPALFPELDVDSIVQVLLEREELGSTGIGLYVAIPHGRFACLEQSVLVVGRSEAGVDFAAIDNNPVHIFFLVLAPEAGLGTHLRLLAHIAKVVRDESFRHAFMECAGQAELWELLRVL